MILGAKTDWEHAQRRFWVKVKRTDQCWEWQGTHDSDGYGQFTYNYKQIKACKIAYILTHGQVPERFCVLHTCDNPSCCRPDHLWLGTTQENTQDKINKGRQARGMTSGLSTTTEAEVRYIRYLYTIGMGQSQITRTLSKGKGCVNAIISGASWKHLGGGIYESGSLNT